MDFRFNYALDCTLSNLNFQELSGSPSPLPTPQTPPPDPHSISDFVLESGFALNLPLFPITEVEFALSLRFLAKPDPCPVLANSWIPLDPPSRI